MWQFQRTWIVALVLLTLATTSPADDRDFDGIVTHVFDGDSFLVRPLDARSGTRPLNVRLNDIDAPEKDQPYADTSRAALIKLLDGRRVFVDVLETDRYERKIAKVYREPDRLEIARILVRDGQVWVNRKYIDDRSLIDLEEAARKSDIGLWSLPQADRIPPWNFRKSKTRKTGRKNAQKAQKSSN